MSTVGHLRAHRPSARAASLDVEAAPRVVTLDERYAGNILSGSLRPPPPMISLWPGLRAVLYNLLLGSVATASVYLHMRQGSDGDERER